MPRRFFNSTTLVFLAIVLLVVVWIGSGMIGREPAVVAERPPSALPQVAASVSQAQEITRELVLYGDIEPAQVAVVRARTDGVVEEIVRLGTVVEPGDALAQLSSDDREARRTRAEAQLASAQRAYDSAVQLFERNAGPEVNVQTTLAQLEAARAELQAVELDIANTAIVAPISGIVNRIAADLGAYVTPGGEVIEIVDNDPLMAVVNVQQAAVSGVRAGLPARVSFIGGEEREGTVRFVSPIADAATRTFRVEVEIFNPGGDLPSGISAEVVIPIDTVSAHRVSAALGRLDEEGRIGIHVVEDDNRIAFVPVEIVRADAGGVWISGLPESARIVTISHGALGPGQEVEVAETPPEYLLGAEEADPAVRSVVSGEIIDAGDEAGETD